MNEEFRRWTTSRGPSAGAAHFDGMQGRYRSFQQSAPTRRYNPNWQWSAQLIDARPIQPNTALSQWRRQLYQEARNSGMEFPVSMRTGIQFFPIGGGEAIVIGVTSWSPVRARIKVGDIITSIDGDPIFDEWEFERHFRITEIEFIDLDTQSWRAKYFWLGLF